MATTPCQPGNTMQRKPYISTLPTITEIEVKTMESWLSTGAIVLTDTGSENLYFLDQFGNQFYCKCYPQ
jgi:hypothetical protein